MPLTTLFTELQEWFATLSADFLFLLALPFAVAAAGLAREWFDARRARPKLHAERRRSPRMGSEHRREHAH